jgi:Fe-S-cluster-containing dehydrogenase component/formate-dependent nitrite reductase membrane component NrfD
MPNYGFAIDLRKCIGCHACTIACKAEHEIPIGVNRCWVKTVEKGTFPATRRFFFPVLCNQCDEAPCARICPTNALFKRRDGIVDLHGDACVGCRACMVACPYDQLFIDPNTHTAEKCNFCANRVENELLPACVSVCPTECRIFGDLDDPASEVARIAQLEAAAVRKPEKGTIPKVFYIGAEESAIQPEVAVRPFIYKEGQVLLRPLASPAPDPSRPGDARVDYDTPHAVAWGVDMAIYLLTKGIATGTILVSLLLSLVHGDRSPLTMFVGPAISLVFLAATAVILVIDLERPERFYYILIRPNWRSWMVWGAYFLAAQGALTALWLAAAILVGTGGIVHLLVWPLVVLSILTTCYTGFLFAQGLARDLWQGPLSTIDLLAQAIVEGSAVLLLAALVPATHADLQLVPSLAGTLVVATIVHLTLVVSENLVARNRTRHHALAVSAIRRGAFARVFWAGAIAAACVSAIVGALSTGVPTALGVAAALALGGSFAWEYIWVEAGQSVPLS